MSAWIVSKRHIDVLTKALFDNGIVGDQPPTLVGRALWLENHRSIEARYGHEVPTEVIDGYEYEPPPDLAMYGYSADKMREVDLRRPEVIWHGVHCYDYQTCEHAAWGGSDPKHWLDQLVCHLAVRAGVVETLPESETSAIYEAMHRLADKADAPWGL